MQEDIIYRGRDWLYNTLWDAVGEARGSVREMAVRCSVNIPVTLLFKDGEPHKALSMDSSDRFIQRVSLQDKDASELEIRDPEQADYANTINPERQVKRYRTLLLDYQSRFRYDRYQTQNAEPFICTATYIDGEREHLTLQKLDILMNNDVWRNQLIMLQGYVPAIKSISGIFERDKQKVGNISLSFVSILRCPPHSTLHTFFPSYDYYSRSFIIWLCV
jgi:hypothetical protein